MFLMSYPSIRGKDLPYHAKNSTCNLLNAYIDENSQRLNDKYSVDGVQSISILQYQFVNMTFDDQSRYKKLFQQVIHK